MVISIGFTECRFHWPCKANYSQMSTISNHKSLGLFTQYEFSLQPLKTNVYRIEKYEYLNFIEDKYF